MSDPELIEDTGEGVGAPAPGHAADVEMQPADKKAGRSAPVLPWMRVPLTIHPGDGTPLDEVGGLDPRLATALAAVSVAVLFPVQTAVWEATAGGASALHDICLAAPTGSGKTLAYALPVIQALSRRPPTSLAALVVLPTRDLALQVHSVVAPLCAAVGVSCCAACGATGLGAEAAALSAGAALVVATPGRLIAHLEGTPGFSLASLRFLVVDEADRLLRQTYQNWLPRVLAAAPGGVPSSSSSSSPVDALTTSNRLIKLVVSATLTKDPSKMDRLGLSAPRYIAMASRDDHRYKLPPGLEELKLVVPAERKPHALAALLAKMRPARVVVFTSAVESTRRLAALLRSPSLKEIVGEAVEYSAALPPEERRKALAAFRSREATVLVASDAMTRGMDVEGVEAVINYDAPVYVKTYVHRAGRTARAGRAGRVVTLLRHADVRHFKNMLRKADNTYVKDDRIEKEQADAVRGPVDAALAELGAVLAAEGGAAAGEDLIEGGVAGGEMIPASLRGQKEEVAGGKAKKDGGVSVKRRRLTGVPVVRLT